MLLKKVFVLFVLVLCFTVTLYGPSLAAERAFNLPRTERKVLPNDLVVLLMEKRDLPLIVFQFLVPVGSAHDPQGKGGLANLTASVLRKGTTTRTAHEIAEQVDFLGANLSINTREDRTILSLEVMSEDAAFAAEFMADLVRNPSFVEEEFGKEKQNVLASLESDKDQPWRYASTVFRRFLLQDHPYAHPVKGYSESVGSIERSDLSIFHENNYRPDGAILAVVGDFDKKKMLKLIKKNFSSWKGTHGEQKKPPIDPPTGMDGRRVCIVDKPDATQTQIRLGNICFPRKSAEFFPALVANTILGGGFSSRLITEVRVNRGLTYSVFSRFSPMKVGGVFYVSSFTKTESTGEALRVIMEEMEKLVSIHVGEDELERAKNYLKGQFPLSLETPEAMARLLLEIEFYELPANYAATFRENVDSITLQDVMEIAHRYFGTSDLAVLAMGKAGEVEAQLEGLGGIETRDMNWKLLGPAQ